MPELPPVRIAIAQVTMHWTTAANLAEIEQAMRLAHAHGALICGFSELAVTGFHRQIAHEARPETVLPALQRLQALAAELRLAIAVGAPLFPDDGPATRPLNAHLLIDEHGRLAASVAKQGLTEPEAGFFARGLSRPVARLQGLRCSAVICREVEDHAAVAAQLPFGSVDLVFVPGALRQDPDKPRSDPPAYVQDIQRLATRTGAHAVQTNWPNALNRPEESVDLGGSVVAAPDGELLLRLPRQQAGLAVFALGRRDAVWLPLPLPLPLPR